MDIKNRFTSYDDFARAEVDAIFPPSMLEGAEELLAYEARSGVFINNGEMNFSFEPFPIEAQFAPVNAIQVLDREDEGSPDVLTAGNFYEVTIERGRYDADYGTLLKNAGHGQFTPVPAAQSGIYLEGQVRDLEAIEYQGKLVVAVARTNDTLLFIRKSNDTSTTVSTDVF